HPPVAVVHIRGHPAIDAEQGTSEADCDLPTRPECIGLMTKDDVLRPHRTCVSRCCRCISVVPAASLQDGVASDHFPIIVVVSKYPSSKCLLKLGYRSALGVARMGEEPGPHPRPEWSVPKPDATRIAAVCNAHG